MSKTKNKFAISLSVAFFLVLSFAPITAKKAHAQWVVFDPGNFANTLSTMIKDYGLDGLAHRIARVTTERAVGEVVQWINSGFQKSPAFVTNPGRYFTNVGDQAAAQFIFSDPRLNLLCGPLRQKIRLSLSKTYTRDNERYRCTISEQIGNFDAFMNDFDQGGWSGFFEVTQRQQNSGLGGYLLAEGDFLRTVSNEQNTRKNELDWGNGFLSLKTCKKWAQKAAPGTLGAVVGGEVDPITGVPIDTIQDAPNNPPAPDKVCVEYQTETPGDVIANQLNSSLQLGNQSLVQADEINEIIGALLSQLVNKAMGGLLSLSRPSGSGGTSVSSALSNTQQTENQANIFGQNQNTRVLEVLGDDPNNPDARTSAAVSAGINPANLSYPEQYAGNPAQQVTPTPNDPNCAQYGSYVEIWADEAVARGEYSTREQAIINLRCPPNGIAP